MAVSVGFVAKCIAPELRFSRNVSDTGNWSVQLHIEWPGGDRRSYVMPLAEAEKFRDELALHIKTIRG